MVLTKGDCDVWVDGLKFINLFSDTYHCLKRIDNDNIHDVHVVLVLFSLDKRNMKFGITFV